MTCNNKSIIINIRASNEYKLNIKLGPHTIRCIRKANCFSRADFLSRVILGCRHSKRYENMTENKQTEKKYMKRKVCVRLIAGGSRK